MSYIVTEADVTKDRETMLRLLANNRTRQDFSYEKRYEWIYENNPDGKAIPWIISNEKGNTPVGFTAVFPRRMLVNGKETICWNCGDFSIEPKYRSLGVALQLRREAKNGVERGKVNFLYAHPNDRMKVVHLKVGHHELGKMHRYALPLRLNSYMRDKLKNKVLASAASFPVNQILNLNFVLRKTKANLEAVLLETPEFDHQHEDGFRELAQDYPVIGVRDQTYLKWKYVDNPNARYMQMNFFLHGRLVGYIMFSNRSQVINIADCVVFPENLLRDVVVLFLREVRKAFPHAASVSIVTFEVNPIVKVIKELNFQYRDDATSSVITYANPESGLSSIVYEKNNWYLSVGDRDA